MHTVHLAQLISKTVQIGASQLLGILAIQAMGEAAIVVSVVAKAIDMSQLICFDL
jgi:hypothetical protein